VKLQYTNEAKLYQLLNLSRQMRRDLSNMAELSLLFFIVTSSLLQSTSAIASALPAEAAAALAMQHPHSDDLSAADLSASKRYMRFGRPMAKRSRRFLKDDDEDTWNEDKRYMRFGRRSQEGLESEDELNEDKRYMRFGRANYLGRYYPHSLGRNFPQGLGRDYGHRLEEDKRYMRFGRVPASSEHDKASLEQMLAEISQHQEKAPSGQGLVLDEEGKSEEGLGEEKRYMRFGRR